MSLLSPGLAALLVLAAFCIATATLVTAAFLRSGRNRPASAPAPEAGFLFDGATLVDATVAGRRILDYAQRLGTDMDTLVAFLAPRFPDLAERVTACDEDETLQLLSSDAGARLTLCARDGRLRISLQDLSDDRDGLPDRFGFAALAEALDRLRPSADACASPVGRQGRQGRGRRANRAYHALAEEIAGNAADAGPLFAGVELSAARPGAAQRVSLTPPGGSAPRWFDCHVHLDGDGAVITALPADATVAAEASLREFVQTLTRTFAHLSVGLAVFDRGRALTVFNPALSDILGLAPEFLIAHPTLAQVLDRLRERQRMPGPKDYKGWRTQIHAREAAAADGRYCETWPLPDGRMIRVTGRPHPGGAVAFLFEDISAEITSTRRYRADLEIVQAVIDGLDEAIAVFSPAARLIFANRAYAALWDLPAGAAPGGESIVDATRRWQERCAPTPVWGDARDFAAAIGERSNWTAEARLSDGRQLSCRFETLPGGATLAAFLPQRAAATALPPSPDPVADEKPPVLASLGA